MFPQIHTENAASNDEMRKYMIDLITKPLLLLFVLPYVGTLNVQADESGRPNVIRLLKNGPSRGKFSSPMTLASGTFRRPIASAKSRRPI